MNKTTRIIFLFAALLAASFVSYNVYNRIAEKPTVVSVESEQEVVQIAVALVVLQRGAKISEQDLRFVSYLKNTLPKGHFTEISKVIGRVVLKEVHETEPILESSLAPLDVTKGGMAAIISPQKRAMAVKVDDVIGVAGFLQPGHLVDVMVSIEKPGDKRAQITKTVLENIHVLSVGTQDQETDDKKPRKVTVVTLEVDLEEGEKLALAVNQGRIQIALRGYTDNDQILTKGTNVASLLKSYATASSEPVKVTKPKNKPTKAPIIKQELVVEVMNGNNISILKMESTL